MKVVVLTGNGGKRLLPLTQTRSKPLLPLGNVPLAVHLVRALKHSGLSDFIFCVKETDTGLMESLGNGESLEVVIRYAVEDRPAGTAGALGRLALLLSEEPFLVIGCNMLFNFDLRALARHHHHHRALATALVARLTQCYESGRQERVEISASGHVTNVQRGLAVESRDKMFPMGIYCFQPEIFQFFRPSETFFDIKEQLLPRLLENGAAVAACELGGNWRYLYTVEDYLQMNREVLEGRFPATHRPQARLHDIGIGKEVRMGRNVNLIPPVVIGDGAVIEDNVQLIGPVAIGDACHIGANAVVHECVMWNGAVIGRNSRIQRCVITEGASVGDAQQVRDTIMLKEQLKPATVNMLQHTFNLTTVANGAASTQPSVKRRRTYELTKRVLDIAFSSVLIVLSFPLMLVLALAIRLEGPGPIFFRQRRCGLLGQEFMLLKFRSMIPDAHRRQKDFHHLNQLDGPVFKITNDPRLTKVGRFLRKFSLDELPQLFNIWMGHMSFVGPRPLARNELRHSPYWSETRLMVKPGLTGLWQINGRSDSSFQDWVAMDTYYTTHQSLWLDLKILFKTPFVVFLGAGAY